MSTSDLARLRAPVEYTDVRARLNTMRAFFGAALTILAITGLTQSLDAAPWVLLVGLYLSGDALWRRGHGASAIPMLVTDIIVIGIISMLRDDPGLIEAVAFLYVLTGALLLLRIPVAIVVIAFAVLVGIPAAVVRPILDPNVSATRELALDMVVVVAIAAIMATLLYGAVQALHASTMRHQTALNAERRAVELKDEFVSMVSHEFRTPLTSIAGFSETLRATWSELGKEEIEEFLIIMRQEAHHLSSLVEDILVIPRIEAGRLRLRVQEFDLAAEVAATSRLVFADTGKEVNAAIPGGVMVKADRGRTGQVLRNLLDNARKYGGDAVEIEGEAGTDIYTISVSDNGPGIAEDDWERVFEHFEQVSKGDSRSDEGVGLGLPIARQLARAMGGDVWYVPRFPTGASFRFSMPLSRIIPQAVAPTTADTGSPEVSTHNPRAEPEPDSG
ncbi:MAG: HAMP domain-containing sensor histidine kinase [Acidimicrobiia bacterium]|nr:HAMP domain-containing sensor histidine kinase [Acidimicrobiia bacterium]